jgi:8-oxo-dGTP diphosphatase
VEPFTRLEQLAVFDAPERDPRTRVVSATFLAVCARAVPPPGGALASGRWWPVGVVGTDDGPDLAFDHAGILTAAVGELRGRLERTDLATALVEVPFTLGDLRRAYEAAWDADLEPANFRRKVLSTPGFVEPTGANRAVGTGRPAELYDRGGDAVLRPPMLRPG